jgi:hypothetical protein
VFEKRIQTLTAELEGFIAECLTVDLVVNPDYDPPEDDPETEDIDESEPQYWPTHDADGDPLWIAVVNIDWDCVEYEEIELVLDTLSANAFNFVADDMGAGMHTVQVQARVGGGVSYQNGSASAKALVGKGAVTVEEVRMIKDEVFEF